MTKCGVWCVMCDLQKTQCSVWKTARCWWITTSILEPPKGPRIFTRSTICWEFRSCVGARREMPVRSSTPADIALAAFREKSPVGIGGKGREVKRRKRKGREGK